MAGGSVEKFKQVAGQQDPSPVSVIMEKAHLGSISTIARDINRAHEVYPMPLKWALSMMLRLI